MKNNQLVVILRWVAIVIMGLLVAFLLFMGIGEMIGGDLSGAGHLIPALLGIVLVFLAWKRPWIGGSILFLVGVLNTVLYGRATNPDMIISAGILIMGVPFLLTGLIFLWIAWSSGSMDQKQQL